jgi:hypothetical protein
MGSPQRVHESHIELTFVREQRPPVSRLPPIILPIVLPLMLLHRPSEKPPQVRVVWRVLKLEGPTMREERREHGGRVREEVLERLPPLHLAHPTQLGGNVGGDDALPGEPAMQ